MRVLYTWLLAVSIMNIQDGQSQLFRMESQLFYTFLYFAHVPLLLIGLF